MRNLNGYTKMKGFIVFLVVATYVAAIPREGDEFVPRTYIPEEENADRQRFIVMQDDDGKYHLVDLKQEPVGPRASASDVTFHLFTQSNPFNAEIIPAINFQALIFSAVFDRNRQNVFIFHGWNNHHGSPVNTEIRSAILQRYNVNVFVVDWSGPANQFYTTARNAVPTIGIIVGDWINRMMVQFGLTPSNFILIGHSLGAHVAGCTGAQVNGLVNSIVGLDPAGPLYTIGNIDNRIDPTDGDYVQIIHTNGNLLGFGTSIGDSDFRPNGGNSQPGCGIDLVGTCAHSRAHSFMAESVRTGRFGARQCQSHSAFNNGQCNNNHWAFMGQLVIDKSARGDYFLNTASSQPFALG